MWVYIVSSSLQCFIVEIMWVYIVFCDIISNSRKDAHETLQDFRFLYWLPGYTIHGRTRFRLLNLGGMYNEKEPFKNNLVYHDVLLLPHRRLWSLTGQGKKDEICRCRGSLETVFCSSVHCVQYKNVMAIDYRKIQFHNDTWYPL